MTKKIFLEMDNHLYLIELKVENEDLDIKNAFREAAIEHCLSTGIYYWENGIDFFSFIKNANESICKTYGFEIMKIQFLSDVINGKENLVSYDELMLHDAWLYEQKGHKWNVLKTAFEISKMCVVAGITDVKEIELLEWSTEYVNSKEADLQKFLLEKCRLISSGENIGESLYG